VFDTQGLLKTGIIMGAARVKRGGRKVGLANGSEGSGYEGISRLFHTESIPLDPRTHAVARGRLVAGCRTGLCGRYAARLRPACACKSRSAPTGCRKDYAVFFHGTARDAKKWASANWIATGHALAPMPVLLPWGSEGEKREAESLAAQLPNARVLPKLSMMDAVTLAQQAALAIGVDTGLTHIAAAFYTPTVEIYADSPKWKTEGNWSPRIVNLGDKGAPPVADEVIASARRLLDSR
jgi:heptosyltransferase-1